MKAIITIAVEVVPLGSPPDLDDVAKEVEETLTRFLVESEDPTWGSYEAVEVVTPSPRWSK
jgi:hypothetical protein